MKRKREEYNYFNIDKPINLSLSHKIFIEDLEYEERKFKTNIMHLPNELLYIIYNFLNTTQKATLRLVNKYFYHFYWKYPLSVNNYVLFQRNWIPFNPPNFLEIKKIKIHTNDIYQFKKTKKRK